MSDTAPSAPVAATVPPAAPLATAPAPAPAPAPASLPVEPIPVEPIQPTGQYRVLKALDYSVSGPADAEGKPTVIEVHLEPGDVATNLPPAAVHALASAWAIETVRVDYTPPAPPPPLVEPEPAPVPAPTFTPPAPETVTPVSVPTAPTPVTAVS